MPCVFLLTKSVSAGLAVAVLYMHRSKALQYYKFRHSLPTLPSTEHYIDQQSMRETMVIDSPFSLCLFLEFFCKCIYLACIFAFYMDLQW